MTRGAFLTLRIAFVAVLLAALPLALAAQESGARPGRVRRNSAAATREFLGLGTPPDRAAAAKGEPLYQQNCAACHGENGRGAQAPSLVRSMVVLHDEKDEQIGPVVHNGRPDRGMPPFPSLSAEDIHNISQFLKLQVELTANRGTYSQEYAASRNKVTGDAKQGESFFQAHCVSCHSVTGDLAGLAAKYPNASVLVPRFLWPSSFGPAAATVTTAAGETFTGKVKRMDDFTIELTDAAGNFHSWPRSQVKVQIEDRLAGHRALLPRYSDADIHNLTAYLVTLK